jgi:hypothetical protein
MHDCGPIVGSVPKLIVGGASSGKQGCQERRAYGHRSSLEAVAKPQDPGKSHFSASPKEVFVPRRKSVRTPWEANVGCARDSPRIRRSLPRPPHRTRIFVLWRRACGLIRGRGRGRSKIQDPGRARLPRRRASCLRLSQYEVSATFGRRLRLEIPAGGWERFRRVSEQSIRGIANLKANQRDLAVKISDRKQ